MEKKTIGFMKMKVPFLLVSAILVTLSLYAFFTKGLNYGIDFEGGIKLVYQFTDPSTNESSIEKVLTSAKLPHVVVQRFGEKKENVFVLRAEVEEKEAEHFIKAVDEVLSNDLKVGNPKKLKEEYVGPKVGKELKRKGQFAVVCTWIFMLFYIWVRFDFNFAPGALIALIHDLFITVGIFSLLGLEVNLTVVAAFLTIIGYSINDTIIIFDRVRENNREFKTLSPSQIVDISLTGTLSRTLVTALTTLFVVLVLFLVAEGDIKNFAFAMIIGILVGTYSSLFIASPFYLWVRDFKAKRNGTFK